MKFEDYITAMRKERGNEDNALFKQGDLTVEAQLDVSDRAKAAQLLSLSAVQLQVREHVSLAFPPETRTLGIPWSLYRELAKIEDMDHRMEVFNGTWSPDYPQPELGWTLTKIKNAVRAWRREHGDIKGPEPSDNKTITFKDEDGEPEFILSATRTATGVELVARTPDGIPVKADPHAGMVENRVDIWVLF